MNTRPEPPAQKLTKDITRVVWGMAIAWTLITAGLFAINVRQHRQALRETAISQARTHFQKDLAFRLWAAIHGGAYVPITEQPPPNPYLSQVPERDIETPSGKKLTLMNPAYITRQIFTQFSEQYGIYEHLTSLKPLNPINNPDAWESAALASMTQGKPEVSEFIDYNGKPHLRQMQALFIQEACLKCHGQQGYKLGDVRGGISISLPMASLLAHKKQADLSSLLSLGIIWLLGLGSLLLGEDILVRRIKERNIAIEELETTQAKHREAQRIAHLGHWELDLTTNNLQWSEEVFRIFEKDPQSFNVSTEAFFDATHPDDREMVSQAYNHSVNNQSSAYDLVHRLLLADGSIKYVHERCETIYDDAGKALRSLGTIQDITERVQAEAALLESEERLQLVLQGAGLGMWDWNIPTGAIIINDRWATMLGYHREEIGPSINGWQKLAHPDDLPAVMAALTAHLEGRTPFYESEYRLRAKSGEWKWIHDTGQVVNRDKSGKPLRAVGIHLDITRGKELEQRVVQQERLSAVGQLTAGIAHDFNNTLTSILGFAQLVYNSKDIPESARENLAIIISSGERAAQLVKQMLDFSRQSIRRPRSLDLVPFFKEIIKFLQSAIPETIQLHFDIAPGDYLVQADPTQIQQLLTNLALNAKDAMTATGGELRIKLSRISLAAGTRCALCDQPLTGDWVEITVSDCGGGMSPEVLPRIFEPFYTTKETGKGSGLGLAQVLGIAKQHGGHITVTSQPGQGTTFIIYLPPVMPNRLPAETPLATPITPGQGETILLAEDEPIVRAAMQTMLQHLGYQVLAAANGQEALEIYAAQQDRIALVLSDMVMPDMDGPALFTALKAKNPRIKVVLMSGYHPGENKTELLKQGLADCFQKPVSLEALSQIIKKAIAG